MKTQTIKNNLIVLSVVFSLVSPFSGHAGIAIVWKADELTRRSDLIVVGKLDGKGQLEIREILKGKCAEKSLGLNLSGFSEKGWAVPATVSVTDEVLVFISQRQYGGIVGNGIFRVGEAGGRKGVLGYWQPVNPGGYYIKPEIQFENMDALKKVVQDELKAIPEKQRALLEKLRKAVGWYSSDYQNVLTELADITRIGDVHISKQVAAIERRPFTARVYFTCQFVRTVNDPEAADILHDLCDQTKYDWVVLREIGRLGNPKSLAYFESLIDTKKAGNPAQVLVGMKELRQTLLESGKKEASEFVEKAILKYESQKPSSSTTQQK
jgi:hypothetical protein